MLRAVVILVDRLLRRTLVRSENNGAKTNFKTHLINHSNNQLENISFYY